MATLFDWLATISGIVFIAFVVGAAFLTAWHDGRGRAHRLPFLLLTGMLALAATAALVGVGVSGRPFPVGESVGARLIASMVVLVAATLLWHGLGTVLKGFVPRRDGPTDLGGPSGLPSPISPTPVGTGSDAREFPRS